MNIDCSFQSQKLINSKECSYGVLKMGRGDRVRVLAEKRVVS